MSHDLVEAALLRRAGWAVHMVALDGGSYEEFPPTLIDHAVRDRRWLPGQSPARPAAGHARLPLGQPACSC